MLLATTDRTNTTDSQGWIQCANGTWSAMTLAQSQSDFKTERGARNWFIRRASDKTLEKMGIKR